MLRRTQAAPAIARSLLSFAWFQPQWKVDVADMLFDADPVCAADREDHQSRSETYCDNKDFSHIYLP